MSQIARLKDAEISNGNLINADDLDAEFNQLVAAHNANDTTLTDATTGTYTFSGVKTFSSTPKMNAIEERTAGSGVTADGVLHKDGFIKVIPSTQPYAPVDNGEFGYDSTNHKYMVRVNGVNRYLVHDGNSGFPKGYLGGLPPVYTSASTITFKTGLRARDSANSADIELTGDIGVSLASSGAAGLDTGAEASNTWYYYYLIRKSSDGTCSVVASVTNESVSGSITYPSGYDQKRQLPFAARNNGSSNILETYVAEGWPYRPKILYNLDFALDGSDPTAVLTAGVQTSFTSISLASFVPPISQSAILAMEKNSIGSFNIRPTGSSLASGIRGAEYDNAISGELSAKTSSSQAIEYRVDSGSIDMAVRGFVVTEIS